MPARVPGEIGDRAMYPSRRRDCLRVVRILSGRFWRESARLPLVATGLVDRSCRTRGPKPCGGHPERLENFLLQQILVRLSSETLHHGACECKALVGIDDLRARLCLWFSGKPGASKG